MEDQRNPEKPYERSAGDVSGYSPESFAEMEEEAMEMYGLPFLVLDKTELEKMPGNLVLDLNLWENQLDRFSKIWV